MFASEHVGARPDMTVLGKSLGAGVVPMAAVIADARLNCANELSLRAFYAREEPVLRARRAHHAADHRG